MTRAGTAGGGAEGDGGPLRLTILGSGTVVPDHVRHPSAYLIESHRARILLDCGAGTLSRLSSLNVVWQELTHVVLTHFHDDHVGGVPGLFAAWKHGMEPARTKPVEIVGPVGTRALLERQGVLDPHPGGLPTLPVEITEVRAGADVRLGDVDLTCHPTPHTEASLAYRLSAGGVAFGFTGDTAPSDHVAAFLAGCDVVVAECSWRDPPPVEGVHLTPRSLAAMARTMDPGLLVLTHVYPNHMRADQAVAGVRAAGWEGRAVAAEDGMRIGGPGGNGRLA